MDQALGVAEKRRSLMRTSPPAGSARLRARLHAFVVACLERDTVLRSLKIALLAGTVLALLTDGQSLLTGTVTPGQWLSLLTSYVVLFGTAVSTQVQGKRRRVPSFTAARHACEMGKEE